MKTTPKTTTAIRQQMRIIESARKGQDWCHKAITRVTDPNATPTPIDLAYVERQKEWYANYQAIINRSEARIAELKREAADMAA